jgi:hypothetical protein
LDAQTDQNLVIAQSMLNVKHRQLVVGDMIQHRVRNEQNLIHLGVQRDDLLLGANVIANLAYDSARALSFLINFALELSCK